MLRPARTVRPAPGARAEETARRASPAVLVEWERRFGEACPLPVWFVDAEARPCHVNPAWRRFAGDVDPQSPSGWLVAVHAEDRELLVRTVRQALRRPEPFRVEFRLRRVDGQHRWMRGSGVPLFEGDAAVALACTCVDVTDGLRAIEELRRENRELSARAEATARASGTSSQSSGADVEGALHNQKLETLGILSGVLAHDFNNLLTGILGNASLVRDELSEQSSLHETLSAIEQAARRASDLCHQMLAYSGRGRVERSELSLNALIEEMRTLLDLQKVPLTFHLEPELPRLEGVEAQLRQVVMNLILNAVQALPEQGGRVTLETSSVRLDEPEDELDAGLYVLLRVVDDGCGMDSESAERMFDSFFTTKLRGHGLGLAAVQRIVGEHRGRIRARSERGAGTTVEVLLPAATHAGAAGVLIIDDEPIVRDAARRMLEAAGLRVLTASDGTEGMALFKNRQDEIGLVLLDLTMPNQGGAETHRQLREIDPRLPVLLISGYDDEEVFSHVPADQVAGFVRKPFTPTEMVVAVERALERAGQRIG